MITRRTLLLAGSGLAAGQAQGRPDADWETSTPQAQGLRDGALAEALASAGQALPGLRAVVVARHGKLVAERYDGGATAQDLLPINSATKSLCALLVGLALRDGRLASLDDTVATLLPDAFADAPDAPMGAVTLRQLLAGRTGLAFDWTQFGRLATANPMTRFVLRLPALAVEPPGWSYNDAAVSLLAPILQRAQGADLARLATRQLFEPLGIDRHAWRHDGEGKPMAAAGLSLRTRDLLKLAQLMIDGGQWRGTQVVPESWVAACLSPQGPATWRAGPIDDVGYGLLWFTGRLHGQRVAWAWGYGGQFALLAPDLKLAVATAATAPPPSALRAQTDGVMTLVGQIVRAAT